MDQSSNGIRGCEAVNDHISKPIPETLWHYTSYAGFQGIIVSKRIWATEYRFLNDRTEFRHAKQLALTLIEDEPEFIGKEFAARDTLRKAVEGAFSSSGQLHEDRLRIMVASFTEEGDQLSQWRGYAENSRGLSIGFDLRALRPPSSAGTAVTFAPCIYRDTEKRALLKAVFAQYRIRLQNWWDSFINTARQRLSKTVGVAPGFGQQLASESREELNKVVAEAYGELEFDLLRTGPLLKDEGFLEEKEWRLVLPQQAIKFPTKHPIEFRPTRDTLVPYIAYPLNSPNQKGPIFCKDVILGPGSHPSAEMAVNLFLRKHEIPLSVRLSKIPYRPT